MSRELDCEIVRDLLPLYLEGLTSPGTGRAVEAHLAGCPACAKAKEDMAMPGAAPAAEQTKAAQKEVDYLKRVRTRSRLRAALAVACTALVLACGISLKVFWLGSDASREGMSWSAAADAEGNALDLRVYSNWEDIAYRDWQVEQQDGIVTITARKVLPSPLCPAGQDYRTRIPLSGVREIYLGGKLLWQDGVTILAGTLDLWETRTPYAGSMPALGKIANALGVAQLCGSFTNKLQTGAEPYGWTLCFVDSYSQQEAQALNRKMRRMAVEILALVENLGQVSWTYTDEAGTLQTQTVTLEQAEQAVDVYFQTLAAEDGSEHWERLGIKDFAETPARFQLLRSYLENWE